MDASPHRAWRREGVGRVAGVGSGNGHEAGVGLDLGSSVLGTGMKWGQGWKAEGSTGRTGFGVGVGFPWGWMEAWEREHTRLRGRRAGAPRGRAGLAGGAAGLGGLNT